MSMNDDKLELLIGRFLDGEIAPAEQRWLDEELERNDQARDLLEQLRMLRECGRQAVAAEVLDRGKGPDEILDLAWQRHQKSRWRRIVGADGHLRFAAGLAAGFLLGLLVHLFLVSGGSPGAGHPGPATTARDVIPARMPNPGVGEDARMSYPGTVMRDVDWYSFTDQSGQQWLVEGVREGSVRPAAYYGDL